MTNASIKERTNEIVGMQQAIGSCGGEKVRTLLPVLYVSVVIYEKVTYELYWLLPYSVCSRLG